MSMEQETLIYIEENDKSEARVLTQSFANKEVKSRAYINALGAELGLKYLALENISNSKTFNLHKIHKVLEELDISDIMLANIHIDVRVVFDENLIFIPKSHFEYDILPDVYLVLNLSEDHAHAKFLGFFEPKLINKNNQNSDYYFIEKEKLSSTINLKEFIESFRGNTTETLSSQETENAELLMVSMMDQDVSKNEMKELLKYLSKSAALRDKFIEFENFELLSYKAQNSPDVTIPQDIEEEQEIDDIFGDLGDIGISEELGDEEISDDIEINESEDYAEGTEEYSSGEEEIGSIDDFEDISNIDEIGDFEDFSDDLSDTDNLNNPIEDIETVGGIIASTATGAAAGAIAGAAIIGAEASIAKAAELGIDVATAAAETAANIGAEIISNAIENTVENLNPEDEVDFDDLNDDSPNDFIIQQDDSEIGETQDFDTLDTIEIPQLQNDSENEMDIIDISDVNAIPNNLDANISETIEFNNIELSSEDPCTNELSDEGTIPTMSIDSIDSFNGLAAVNNEDMEFTDDSVDLNNLMAPEMDTLGAIPMPDAMDAFAPVDLDNINLLDNPIVQNNGASIQEHAESIEDIVDDEELNSSLNEIPDFGSELSEGLGIINDELLTQEEEIPLDYTEEEPVSETPELDELGGLDDIPEMVSDEISEDELDSVEEYSAETSLEPEISDFNALESLSVDDIIEESHYETDELSQSIDDSNISGESIPDISDIPDENPEFSEIAGLDELEESSSYDNFDDLEQLSENSEPETSDIENAEQPDDEHHYDTEDGNELTMLFNENQDSLSTANQIQNLESPFLNKPKQSSGMKTALVAVVAAVLIAGTGIGLFVKNKQNSAQDVESLAQTEPETGAELPIEEATTDNSDILANTPAVETIPAVQTQQEPTNFKEVKPAPSSVKSTKPINPSGTYLSVKKLSWEVPDYLSYSENMTKYLQTAGKSIKLSLSSDLLLVSEFAYSNQVKVSMKLSSDGTLKDIQLVKSSGSDQINKIVLQTVKDTLNVIKPATGEVPTPEFKLGLTINF